MIARAEYAAFRQALLQELQDLEAQEIETRDDRQTVTLDQQSVGRLSRMDAIQRQAMAKAQEQRREHRRMRVSAALLRIEADEFGYCTDCGEALSPGRLELDPAVPLCLSCARG